MDHIAAGADQSLVHQQAGIAYPDTIITHLKAKAQTHPIAVAAIERRNGQWHGFDDAGQVIAKADICIIAAGTGTSAFYDFGADLGARAGQLTLAPITGDLPTLPVSGAGYGARFGNRLAFGATYERWPLDVQTPPDVSAENHLYNKQVLGKIAPELAERIDLTRASGRTSIRVTTRDQMPITGRMPDSPQGLYIVTGLGSRGFTSAFICAEVVVALACGEPAPVEEAIGKAISPDRFIIRRHKRSKG
jgi:tRNA 5-methylaminomethyl-2-thiouridine biosynthesis bifunctional protein